jgi:hypothetical protein
MNVADQTSTLPPRERQLALNLRRIEQAAWNSRLNSSMVDMPGLSGNLAIEATLLFSSGHSARRAIVRA